MIEITELPIDSNRVLQHVHSTSAGAVVLFLGTTRAVTDGRQTESLDYQCYREMAEKKMYQLQKEAGRQWPIIQCAIVHRIGHLKPGETSVAIAVSSPHREDAFQAGKWLIDAVKEVVPIWKQENWGDGTRQWVHPGIESPVQHKTSE